MKFIWLLFSVFLVVACSESQEEFDLEEDSSVEEFNNVIDDLVLGLDDDDFTEFDTEYESEEEIDDDSDDEINELFSSVLNNPEFLQDSLIDGNEFAGLLSGLVSGKYRYVLIHKKLIFFHFIITIQMKYYIYNFLSDLPTQWFSMEMLMKCFNILQLYMF